MSMITSSFVIRTYNEQKWIGQVLKKLASQTRGDFEVIIVDSSSTDDTLQIVSAFSFVSKILSIKKKDFNYSYAANLGTLLAQGEFVGFLSGHSVPCTNKWYEKGVSNFSDKNVVAVSGYHSSLPDGSTIEKNFDISMKDVRKIRDEDSTWISNTNSLIRKSSLLEYPFDERITAGVELYDFATEGGEDYDFCQEMRARGKRCIIDPGFNVMHSHGGLDRITHVELRQTWAKICRKIDMKVRPSQSYSTILKVAKKKADTNFFTKIRSFMSF